LQRLAKLVDGVHMHACLMAAAQIKGHLIWFLVLQRRLYPLP